MPSIFTATLAGGLGLLLSAGTLEAAAITYTLPDVGTFAGYNAANTGQSYTGNGFVGFYNPSSNTLGFAHLFGVEANSSRTLAQQNISALAGATISSATVSFRLLDGETSPQTVTVSSVATGGALNFQYTPTTTYGSVTLTAAASPTNIYTVDVTSLLQARVAANATYFGMHFAGSTANQWTYTNSSSNPTYSTDRAELRLNVTYTVPEPACLAGLASGGLLLRRRRR